MHSGERLHPGESTLELPDVALHLVRDEVEHFLRDQASFVAELGMKDGEASLEIRGLDVRDESPLESRPKTVLERRDLLGRAVRRDDDLLVDLVQRVERVKELFFRPVLAGEEL